MLEVFTGEELQCGKEIVKSRTLSHCMMEQRNKKRNDLKGPTRTVILKDGKGELHYGREIMEIITSATLNYWMLELRNEQRNYVK